MTFMWFLGLISRGGAIIGLVLLVVALLEQLIAAVGILIALIKFAIIVAFVAVMVMIAIAIWRSRQREKAERKAN